MFGGACKISPFLFSRILYTSDDSQLFSLVVRPAYSLVGPSLNDSHTYYTIFLKLSGDLNQQVILQ